MRLRSFALFSVIGVLGSVTAHAATQATLSIPGSLACGKDVAVRTWSTNATVPINATGSQGLTAGRVQLGPVVLQKGFDSCSNFLIKSLLQGSQIATITLLDDKTVVDSELEIVKLTLTGAFIASYKISTTETLPGETVTIDYTKLCIESRPQLPDGTLGKSVQTCYDRRTNTVE